MATPARSRGSPIEVLDASLRLGLTSFGGPIAHIGYFRHEYVLQRRWLDEATYADLVALCQFLPGPASSQLGIAIGTRRAGMLGGLLSWVGFTLPSAVALVLFGLLTRSVDLASAGWVHGLKLAAVAVVAQAVWAMAGGLAPDWPRRGLALLAAAVALAWTSPVSQVAIIAGGALVGRFLLAPPRLPPPRHESTPISSRVGVVALALFVGLLLVLPLFTFAAYLGAVTAPAPNGVVGAIIALVAIFLPSFLLVFGALPFWDWLRGSPGVRRALAGTNAAVVGILLAALYTPIWTNAVATALDVVVAGAALALLMTGRIPPIAVVGLSALAGQALRW